MDFGTVPDWVLALSAVAASWQGVVSLSAWRREEGGRRRMKLAETALADFYEARDILRLVRSRATEPQGSSERPDRRGKPDVVQLQRDVYYPVLRRLADEGEFFGRMHARRYRVQALFGPQGMAPYDLIEKVHREVATAAKMLVQTRRIGDATEAELARDATWQETVWDDATLPDTITTSIDGAIHLAEEVFRPEIVGHFSVRSGLM